MAIKRTIRQAQLVVPFGVGAIVDIGPESFVVADISRWNGNGLRRIEDSRLEDKLRRAIRSPAAKEDATSVAIARFPKWHFCPRCRLMRRVSANEDEARGYPIPKCEQCRSKTEMTPMGFVSVCKDGHLGEVDWHYWAHLGAGKRHGSCSPQGARLYFETSGQGGGDWAAIRVHCGKPSNGRGRPEDGCGASNDFTGLVQVEAPGGMACRGRQPWSKAATKCGSKPRVFRRAASNLHFPTVVSALDLAADPDAVHDGFHLAQAWEGDPNFVLLKTVFAAFQRDLDRTVANSGNRIEAFAARNGCSLAAARAALGTALAGRAEDEQLSQDTGLGPMGVQQQILGEEWTVLAAGREISGRSLQIRPAPPSHDWPAELHRTIAGVSMVRRLREVRALLGFRRLGPGEENALVPVDLGDASAGWYPGVEAWGEGIFIKLSEEAVRAWERACGQALLDRLGGLAPKVARIGWDASLASPRFQLLHSLSHAIVKRLSFDAGYSASSIRERIYASAEGAGMCGILIYTADGDSEGSLGGLVRMGSPERFGSLLAAALQDVAWCSADPVCGETQASGMDGLNAASCHACLLVSETSCSHNNSLLDRGTLVGIGSSVPFFQLGALLGGAGRGVDA